MNQHGNQRHGPKQGPYWKRVHHDWRFYVGIALLVAAITVYLMSDDLRLQPQVQTQTPASN